MITNYQVIQVVFWFYSSITFASVVVCMHVNWSWSQVLHISYLGIDTATQRRVLQLYIIMPNPFVGCIPCPICVPSRYNSGVNFWSNTVWSWTNGNMGKATCQQCPDPTICYWTTVREYLLINCRFIRGQRVGHWLWLWIHVMNYGHDVSPLYTQTMPAGYPFSWKTWKSYQSSIQQSMMLSWRECVLYNGVIRSATVVFFSIW